MRPPQSPCLFTNSGGAQSIRLRPIASSRGGSGLRAPSNDWRIARQVAAQQASKQIANVTHTPNAVTLSLNSLLATILIVAWAEGTMARYHFHVRINGEVELDTDGVELSCETSARDVVVECLREFFIEPRSRLPVKDWQFEVVNEVGALVMTVPFMAGLDS